jgi:penicillin amidase
VIWPGVNLPRLALGLLLGRRPARLDGEFTAPGIAAPVLIRRDTWGVPHITAETEPDAWYGLGFCHGQDRSFQLEGLLRVVRGSVAELAGPGAVGIDRLSRRIGLRRSAELQLGVLSPERRAAFEAYASGITAGRSLGLPRQAHEFALLRSQPTPWAAADAIAAGKLQSCLLISSWDSELARLKILSEDGPEALAALDPAYPAWQPVSTPATGRAGPALDRLAGDLALLWAAVGGQGGSNNWALAGERTASHRPILANDPHLASSLPPHWYLCHIQTPLWAAAGASFVGIPALAAGHNGFAAWGLTAGCVDNADLFLEELGPDGRTVRDGDGFVECSLRTERITVKGGATVVEEILETPRGPIISPAIEGETRAISLRAVWLDALPVEGLLRAHEARSFDDFRRFFAAWPGPSLNMAYADESGSIGWQLAGQAPRRREGLGSVPLPGWEARAGWEDGLVPFKEMPFAENPSSGFVATANNRPVPAGEGPFLGEDWIDGYRVARIAERLAQRSDWDVASTQALQLDQQSLPWREMRGAVLRATGTSPDAQLALQILGDWDGVVAPWSVGATVFELFATELARRLAQAKAPRSYEWALSRGFSPLLPQSGMAFRRAGQLAQLLRDQPDGWFDRPWVVEIGDSLAAAVASLRTLRGPRKDGWAWGVARPLTLRHAMSVRRPLGSIFDIGPFPWGGDTNTVGQASVDPLDPLANSGAIASLRLVVDVGAWENCRFVLPGGQSGNPFSPHYADQVPLWRRGAGIPIPWTEAAVAAVTQHSLRLLPCPADTE